MKHAKPAASALRVVYHRHWQGPVTATLCLAVALHSQNQRLLRLWAGVQTHRARPVDGVQTEFWKDDRGAEFDIGGGDGGQSATGTCSSTGDVGAKVAGPALYVHDRRHLVLRPQSWTRLHDSRLGTGICAMTTAAAQLEKACLGDCAWRTGQSLLTGSGVASNTDPMKLTSLLVMHQALVGVHRRRVLGAIYGLGALFYGLNRLNNPLPHPLHA